MKNALKSLLAAVLAAGAVGSQAAVIAITEAALGPPTGTITFSEFAIGTVSPTYTAAQYGGTSTAPGVGFGSFFVGQSQGTASTCPPGVALGGCVVGSPTGPLALDLVNGAGTFITTDPNHPTSPVLSGRPTFNGAIAMLFGHQEATGFVFDLQAAIGFEAGFFNSPNTTAVTAYSSTGAVLGQFTNTGTGIQFLGIGTDDGTAQIAGLLISFVLPETAGFSIDNVRFGAIPPSPCVPGDSRPECETPGETPEPSSLALVGLALLGLGAARRRRVA